MKYDIEGVRHGTIIKVDNLPDRFDPGDAVNIHIKSDTIKILITDIPASCDSCTLWCKTAGQCSIVAIKSWSRLCVRPDNKGRFLMPVLTEKLLEQI